MIDPCLTTSHIWQVLAVLHAHADAVRCLHALPDGGLATGGGPEDRTVRIWRRAQWEADAPADEASADGREPGGADHSATRMVREAAQTLHEPGYVFALTSLPDAKPGSQLFALACARYNTVRICL